MARILACGAFLKNAACLLDTEAPNAPLWSAVHGALSDPAACVALEQSVQALLAQAGGPIDAVAHDLHPDFFSTHLALRLALDGAAWGGEVLRVDGAHFERVGHLLPLAFGPCRSAVCPRPHG